MTRLEALVGKTVLVGIERVVGEVVRSREQHHGVIVAVDEASCRRRPASIG